jgi:sugar/nucleoside kinase (ribokinase family)
MSSVTDRAMSSATSIDYLVIGHITRDRLPAGDHALGGTASYAALTAAALGHRPGVVTSVGPDVDLARFAGVAQLALHPARATTTFENVYREGHREQYAYAVAHHLTPSDVPAAWRRCPVVHVGPVLRECDPALVRHFAERSGAFVGVTPQGWMRTRDAQGRVVAHRWQEAAAVLPRASAVVLSLEDVAGDWDLVTRYARQSHILVVTEGWRGGVCYVDGVPLTFPSFPVTEEDPTGAGDIFATAFFSRLASGASIAAALRLGACVAARSVTRQGLAAVPRPTEVAACMAMGGEP